VPEGDSVLVAANHLNAALAGKVLRRSDLRVPGFATSDLSGQTILEVASRGKHLLFRTDAGITLHTHFRMDGTWKVYGRGERWRHGPAHQVRVVLETDELVAVGFRLPVVELLSTERESHVVGHLGPDVLGPDWDPDEAVRRLTARPERAIGEALIDQTVMAGPGNVYKSEALFLTGVDPWTPVGSLRDPAHVVDMVKRLMEANRTTGMQITTGDRRPGRTHWVYGRERLLCRRCDTPIRKAMQLEGARESHRSFSTIAEELDRVTYWCPHCQPASASVPGELAEG
jgi:endonuclease VIII